MHPLCCISPVQIDGEGSPISGSVGSKMDVHVDSNCFYRNVKSFGNVSNRSLPPVGYVADSRKSNCVFDDEGLDPNSGRSVMHGYGGKLKNATPDGSFRLSHFSGELVDTKDGRATKDTGLNCPVGSIVAGVLYKWVNYGKGWRPRWFVLQEGVLSYYKVHGPDRIVLSRQTQKGVKLIGDESQRFMRKYRYVNADDSWAGKTFGELHMKVSSIRSSKSDDKKFYLFTGTKTLFLRADTREDRAAWLDALTTAKDLFPKGLTFNNLTLPFEERTVSTERLRNRLVENGLSDEAVIDCENIMLSEFSELQEQFKVTQQSSVRLIERLRQLEAEKVELENTVVDESQNHYIKFDCSRGLETEKECEGSGTESDEDIEKQDGMDPDSDEDDGIFFDTEEFLSGSCGRQSWANSAGDMSDQDAFCAISPRDVCKAYGIMELFDFKYPCIRRRKSLPEPKEKEKCVSLWSLIKDNIGKDLTRVCLPVYFNEPLSSLQKCFEDLEYSHLLDRAYEWGKRGDSLMRILNVAAFAISGYSSTEDRICKPFNPLLGETYEADYPDKGLHFFSEKVSHHPMIVACHCEGRGWKFWADSTVKSKFWGRSIQLDPVGILTLQFDDGEVFQWSKVTTTIYNLILGKLYCDHYGTMRIQGSQDVSCKLKFKEQSIIDRNPHQVQGFVHDRGGKILATLLGKWDESIHFVKGDATAKPKGCDALSEATVLWKKNKPAQFPTRYNLTSFAITLNELTPELKEKLPPTDSRLRPDQRHLENGEYDKAFAEKLRLEQKQRQARKLQERGWQPRWFRKENEKDTYEYTGGYWEAREQGKWVDCPNIFGPGLPAALHE